MKHEWKKQEKELYLPKAEPVFIDVPEFAFFSIEGEGNPNSSHFSDCIDVLYSLSYAVRMSYKLDIEPVDFYEYTVYPLEGVWDLNDQAKKNSDGTFNKDDLIFKLMIRQPSFVTSEFADTIIKRTKDKKPNKLLDDVKYELVHEGQCVQMLHVGSYDNEPETFRLMELYCGQNRLVRAKRQHREIYLSDARKVSPEKLKTVLRFEVTR